MATDIPRCAQCGAPMPPGVDCEACFHALLAFENERPATFRAVHHLTVASYYLQHPQGYRDFVIPSGGGAERRRSRGIAIVPKEGRPSTRMIAPIPRLRALTGPPLGMTR